jgi:hypothetical protein
MMSVSGVRISIPATSERCEAITMRDICLSLQVDADHVSEPRRFAGVRSRLH